MSDIDILRINRLYECSKCRRPLWRSIFPGKHIYVNPRVFASQQQSLRGDCDDWSPSVFLQTFEWKGRQPCSAIRGQCEESVDRGACGQIQIIWLFYKSELDFLLLVFVFLIYWFKNISSSINNGYNLVSDSLNFYINLYVKNDNSQMTQPLHHLFHTGFINSVKQGWFGFIMMSQHTSKNSNQMIKEKTNTSGLYQNVIQAKNRVYKTQIFFCSFVHFCLCSSCLSFRGLKVTSKWHLICCRERKKYWSTGNL